MTETKTIKDISDLLGEKVFVRTVTHFYTGRLEALDDNGRGFIRLAEAAWIADTGRFATALASGNLNEIEPYPGTCWVSTGAIVDLCAWNHELPRKTK